MPKVALATSEADLKAFHELRYDVFIKKLGWGLESFGGSEIDIYDKGQSQTLVVKDAGKVIGGCRVMPCCREWRPGVSYMIRDAALGRLQGFPRGYLWGPSSGLLWGPPPVGSKTLELTRVVALGVDLRWFMEEVRAFARSIGAKRCIYMARKEMIRLGRVIGLVCEPLGPEFLVDGKAYLVMATNV